MVRAVQSLPGVARPPGLSPLIIIRGSEPDDSLFMIDGFRSSLLYHLTGQGVVENETVEPSTLSRATLAHASAGPTAGWSR